MNQLNICYVCPYSLSKFGGVQNQVLELAKRAALEGHNVTILAPNSRKDSIVTVISNGVEVKIPIVSVGRAVPIPIGRGTVSPLAICYVSRLREILTTGGFDVVHVHEPVAPSIGPLACNYTVKDSLLVTTSHTNIKPNLATWMYSTFGRMVGGDHMLDDVNLRLAVSPAAANRANHYLPNEYRIIPNGIDAERFSPNVTPFEEYLDGKINILFVGRMGDNELRKGLFYLVSAYNEVHWQHPNTRLLLVGPGEPDWRTRELVHATDHEDIIFIGPVSFNDLPRWYATADVFASTPTDGESFSLVDLEGMAARKPVLTSNIEGPRDVLLGFVRYGPEVVCPRVYEAKAGILVQPRDIPGIAEGLEILVTDENKRREMGMHGRQIVLETFSLDVVVPELLGAYVSAFESRKAAISV